MAKREHRGITLRKHADDDKQFAGISIMSDHDHIRVPTSTVERGISEGWARRVGEKVVHRPGGTAEQPWLVTHTFVHADAIVFDTLDGDQRFKVVGQPDKYDEDGKPVTADGGVPGEVRWYYDASREA